MKRIIYKKQKDGTIESKNWFEISDNVFVKIILDSANEARIVNAETNEVIKKINAPYRHELLIRVKTELKNMGIDFLGETRERNNHTSSN